MSEPATGRVLAAPGEPARIADPKLVATHPLRLLDELGVPYAHGPGHDASWHRLTGDDPARALYWHSTGPEDPVGWNSVWGIRIWGAVAADEVVARFAVGLPGRWRRDVPVLDARGAARSWVWTSDDGGTILPFDPDELIANYRSERYCEAARTGGAAQARAAYYRVKPLVPRRAQIATRRVLSRMQQQVTFPRWPAETALHDLVRDVFQLVLRVAGTAVPFLAAWPDGHTWSLVLTHDVETAVGRDAIERLRAVEAARGLRSCWNLVPERYAVDDALVAHLRGVGCEVGVHGLRHDGRDLQSLTTLARRLPEMRRWAARWQATGFRSPATHRVWDWMPSLGFDYDSSYPDTDPYEPMGGGCCTWLPFFNRSMVELPITLAQDHTIFSILGIGDGVWHEKAALLKRRGGMALIDIHPDYMLTDEPLAAYERLLDAYAGDPDVWTALPCEVSDWWRRRAATSLHLVDGSWRAVGPAAGQARISVAGTRDGARL